MGTSKNIMMILWSFSEILLLLRMRSGNGDAQGKDKKSLSFLWMVIGLGIFFGVFISKTTFFPFYSSEAISILVLTFLFLGVVFRLMVISQLGKYFTVDVTIRKDHQLITNGFYQYLRHPSDAFSLLTFLGLTIVLNNYFAAIVIVVPVFLMCIYQINIEEKVLKEQFGKYYTDCMKITKRIIPYIY